MTKHIQILSAKTHTYLGLDMNFTPMQRIERMKVSMMRHPSTAYLSGVLMIGNVEVTDRLPTAGTNGRDVFFNPDFIRRLSDAELRGLIYHEYGGHILYRHLSVFGHLHKEDAELANMACDYVVNQIIADLNVPDFLWLPPNPLQDDKYRGMDSQMVFNSLKAEQAQGKSAKNIAGNGTPVDSHDWEGAANLSPTQVDRLTREVEMAVRQGAMAAKLVGSGVPRDIERRLAPRVPWQEVLRELLTSKLRGDDYATYQRPNRRWLSHDMVMPTHRSDAMGALVVAVDTSYSIDNTILGKFIAEIAGICDTVHPEIVHVIYWGSSVAAHEQYDQSTMDNLRLTTIPKHGGGTNIDCVPAYLSKQRINPECVVVLSDGELYGQWGNWSEVGSGQVPLIWALTNEYVADQGVTIHLGN